MTQFMPHGMCYLWKPELVWLHAISDGAIALALFSIPAALLYVVRDRRRDLPVRWTLLLFASFLAACGATHAMGIWTLWNPDHWVAAGVNVVTGLAGLGTAVLLVPMLPRIVAFRSPVELERMNEELEDANRRLEREVVERRRTEAELRRREELLAEAQRIAHLGSWEWDVESDRVTWSDEMYRIYGFEPGSHEVDFGLYLQRVHPEDRDRVAGIVREALETGEAFEFEERIVRPDGEERILDSVGYVVAEEGKPVRIVGTCHDVTESRLAEEARRESEKRYRMIVETSQEGVWTIDAENRTTYVNDRMAGLLGLDPEEMIGRPLWDFMDDEDREQAERNVERRRSGIREEHEFRLRRPDGEYVMTYMSTSPLTDDEGRYVGALAMVTDIGDLKDAEASLRLLARAGEIFGTSLEFSATVERVSRVLVESLADLCFFDVLSDRGEVERCGWAHADPGRRGWLEDLPRYAPSPGETSHPIARVLATGESAFVPRVDDAWLERVARDEAHLVYIRRLDFGSFLSVPIVARGRILGALTLSRTRGSRPFTDADRRLAEELGRRAGIALDNARLYEELRRSEEEYRLLAEHASDTILRFSRKGEITYASPAARNLLGYAPTDLVGRSGGDFIHPEDRASVEESHRALLKEPGSRSVIARLGARDGSWVWVEATSRGVRDLDTGRVTTIVSVARDVSESVAAARTIRLLEQVATAANESDSVADAMKTALGLLCAFTGWPVGHVHLPARNLRGELAPTDIWHLEDPDRFPGFREVTEATRFRAGEGLPGRVLESGRAEWIEDVREDPGFLRRAGRGDLGVRAAFAFPVRSSEATVAVLEFFSDRPGGPGEATREVMESVGGQLGQVVARQRTEAALRASEMRFRALAESASDGIVTADEENRIVYCNEAVERIFGWSQKDLVGRPLTTLMPERFRAAFEEAFERFLETREPTIIGRPIELVGRHETGREIPVELSIGWWEGDEGVFFTGVLRDVTNRKRTEAALNEKVEELARSNAELGLFTYVASHDLREPLRTVGSNVQLVARRLGPEMDEDVSRSIDFALGGVRRMQKLIDDLLVYSRVGTEGRTFGPVDVGVALSEATENLEAAIEESAATITQDALPSVQADRSQMVQLFQNLISNAIKFSGPGPPRVHVSAERGEEGWTFVVADEGIGIEPRHADDVFTIFERLHPDEEIPGTGIGLAVCRKIVERHGGRIWVESEPGRGSEFKFTIPVRE